MKTIERRKRGRLPGEGKGTGAVQLFINRNGGRRYLKQLNQEFQSTDAIADFIYRKYNFYCCSNSVRNMMRSFKINSNATGGDRRSPGRCRFRELRGGAMK